MSEVNTALARLDDGAPPPLSPLTHVVINPQNIIAEARIQNAQSLTWLQRRRIRSEVRRLTRKLKSLHYPHWKARRAALIPELERLQLTYNDLKAQLQSAPDDEQLQAQRLALLEQVTPLMQDWRETQLTLRPLQQIARDRRQLIHRLEDHYLNQERARAEKQLMLAMQKEAAIYENLIIDKLTRLGFCHRYTHKGKERVQKIGFSEVSITVDSIYYKIDASYQTAFKNWKTNLPNTVYVSDVLAERTLFEMTITCQRQVTGVSNTNGAWIVVHRLDSVDGLMNSVTYDQVMERYPVKHHSRFPVCVGVGLNRQVAWINFVDFPHWLVGGYTNSGKSNMVNVIISTLITRHSPQELRLVLIDLKGGLEFSYYSGIPHLHGEIVDTVAGVADSLAELEALMHERFRKFKGITKLLEIYQQRRPHEYMPRVVVLFDEVASMMGHGELSKRISASLRDLVRMGRAVGIHIVLSTQRPDVLAIDGAIKANLAVRLSGRMSSATDSMTILGNSSAKDLAAVPGRMIMQLGPDPTPIQTPFIDAATIENALNIAKEYPAPPPLDVPADVKRVVHQQWNVERVIELSIKHLGGNVSAKRVYEAVDDLSKSQAADLVEQIWTMPVVLFDGKSYMVEKRKGGARYLVEQSEDSKISSF